MDELYSLENARKFNWSSVTGNLNSERVSHLETYVVGEKILDAGCGGGGYVEFLSQKGLKVTGIDKYKQFLQLSRETNRIGTYVQGDITELPFPDKNFICTYCFDVLEHVDDHLAIQELARVTTKRIIIAVPKEDEIMNKFGLTFLHYQDKTHLRNYTETYLKDLILTVNPANIVIFPELAVPAQALVSEMIVFTNKSSGFKSFYKKNYNFILKKLLDKALYKEIYTGLVAIVDL